MPLALSRVALEVHVSTSSTVAILSAGKNAKVADGIPAKIPFWILLGAVIKKRLFGRIRG